MALPDGAALRRWKTVTWARQSAILVAAEGDEQQGSQSYVLGRQRATRRCKPRWHWSAAPRPIRPLRPARSRPPRNL